MGEHRQRLTSGERCGGGEQGVEAGVSCSCGNRLGDRVVVSYEVGLVDTEVSSHGRVGQVEDIEVDVHPADASPDLERVNVSVDEVAEQLGPSRLLLTRRVPDARFARPVVAARATSGIRTRCERVPGGTLVPEAAGDLPTRRGCCRLGEVHT